MIALIVACIVPPIVGQEQKFTVSGVGSYPISGSIESVWLAAPDHRPLLMVYFHGPKDWHNTKWKVDSKFEKGKPGWVELQSEKVTLRLSMNSDSGEAGVQSGKFKITESNTFLVLHTAEPSTPQRIVALGTFDLPASKDQQPASVLLLRANPELMDHINKEVGTSEKEQENFESNCAGKTAVPQTPTLPKSQPAQSASEKGSLDKVFERMDQTAREFRSTQADFVWKMHNSVINDFIETDIGKIYFRRTGTSVEMAADITKPAPKQVIFSGGRIQILESDGQKDVYDASAHREEFEAFLVLGFGSSSQEMRKSFNVQYLGNKKVGDIEAAKLELTPVSEKIKANFPRIDLWIDPELGVSIRQQLCQSDGDYRLADYSNFKPNEKIPDKVFTLRKPANAQTVTR